MSVTSPVETLAEGQTAEELVRLVTEPAHAGAVELYRAGTGPGRGGAPAPGASRGELLSS